MAAFGTAAGLDSMHRAVYLSPVSLQSALVVRDPRCSFTSAASAPNHGSNCALQASGDKSVVRWGRLATNDGIMARNSKRLVANVEKKEATVTDSLTDEDSEGIGEMGLGQRELKDYPPGLQRYETMAVLRPDISEEQRLELTQRYEEAIIAGGGLDVEMFNRGMQPLAYNIRTKDMSGLASRYLDGIYLLFTYVTKPESQLALQKRLNADDDIIRSTTFRLKV